VAGSIGSLTTHCAKNPVANEQTPSLAELFDLRGRVAMVTGAAGHLGSAMAIALAEAGSRVICTSRELDRARSVAASLPDPHRVQHFGLAMDQLDAQSIDHCVASVIEAAGRIDVLVNNAHEPLQSDWTNVSADEFNRQLANATAYFELARHVRNKAVEKNHPASIIMIGSMYGLVGSYPEAYAGITSASSAAYHALKGGIVQLTRHLAVYWAKDNVRVNCLSPGPFPKESANPQLIERLIQKSPMGRMGQPYELKGPLLLLASDAASYITGQNLVVDGGWTAW
jgi:NAD(P)-dependent dehydrogenase (short-subunit alcohol dehydrogenase family)